MGAQDLGVAGRVGDAEVVVGEQSARAQAGAQQGIFLHRKAVPIGQRQDEVVGVVELQGGEDPVECGESGAVAGRLERGG